MTSVPERVANAKKLPHRMLAKPYIKQHRMDSTRSTDRSKWGISHDMKRGFRVTMVLNALIMALMPVMVP